MLSSNLKQLVTLPVAKRLLCNFKSGTFSQFYKTNRCLGTCYPWNGIIVNVLPSERIQIRNYAKKVQGKVLKGGKKTMHLSDEEMAEVIDIFEYKNELQLVLDKMKKDYAEYLSLRSPAGNIDNIIVKIDKEEHPLNELARISKKNPNLIAINMSDFPEALKPAIEAITESGAGMTPQQEGTMIYLTVPKLTREHRENLSKNAKALCVKAKEEVRHIQNSYVKQAKDKTELSKDLVFSATNQVMAIAEKCNEDLEKLMKSKQKELLGDS